MTVTNRAQNEKTQTVGNIKGSTGLRRLGYLGFAAVALFFGATGCAPEDNGVELDEASADVASMPATLDNVQTEVFDKACASCHSAEAPAGGLDLSNADASYAGLVEMPAQNTLAQENRWMLVTPEDPDLSFLCRKIEQPGLGEGAPMPPGDKELAPAYVDLIEDWIADGAQR